MYDSDNKKWLILNYPFHNASRSYPFWSFSGSNPSDTWNSPRIQEGRTNQVNFDGHAESVRGWKGTVNPCYVDKGC